MKLWRIQLQFFCGSRDVPKWKTHPGCPAMSPHKIPWLFPDHFRVFPDHMIYYRCSVTTWTVDLWGINHLSWLIWNTIISQLLFHKLQEALWHPDHMIIFQNHFVHRALASWVAGYGLHSTPGWIWVTKSVRVHENFEGHAGQRTHKNIKIAGPTNQMHVLTVGTNVILRTNAINTNYCQPSRTCKLNHFQVHPLYCKSGAEDMQVSEIMVSHQKAWLASTCQPWSA